MTPIFAPLVESFAQGDFLSPPAAALIPLRRSGVDEAALLKLPFEPGQTFASSTNGRPRPLPSARSLLEMLSLP